MKAVIAGDTHGYGENLKSVLQLEAPMDLFIHTGDGGDCLSQAELMLDPMCRMVAVRGNNDFFSDLPEFMVQTLGAYRFFITHGHRYGVYSGFDTLLREAERNGCNVAVFGHTHMPTLERHGNILLINPGSLTYPRQMGRRPAYAVFDTDRGEACLYQLKENTVKNLIKKKKVP